MISLCSVVLDKIKHYEEIFLKSVIDKTKLVSEVILINNSQPIGTYKTWTERGIQFKEFGNEETVERLCCGDQHGIGLNIAIEKASNDVVYLCDPDTFFITAADEFFYDLKIKYNLQAIGCSHHSATELCGTFFPWHGNVMLNKKDLPDKTWLPGLKVPGCWLEAGAGSHKKELYPNPEGNFDTASALWLLAHERNWRWLAFQTANVHVYTNKFYRGSVKVEKMKPQELLYHAVSGSIETAKWEPYIESYEHYSSR